MPKLWIATLLLLIVGSHQALGGEIVTVAEADAAARQPRLSGYLARPSAPGLHPGLVVLHSCAGLSNQTVAWADLLARFGYVAIAVDSFGPRGITDRCTMPFQEQTLDAWRGRDFLAAQSDVQADSIGVIGFSMGGGSALAVVERGLVEQLQPWKFRVAIGFYPRCVPFTGEMIAPTLILIGELDEWTPAQDCRDMLAGRSGPDLARRTADRSMVRLVVYPGVHHDFDFAELRFLQGARVFGRWVAYDEFATRDSIRQVREFLGQHLPPR